MSEPVLDVKAAWQTLARGGMPPSQARDLTVCILAAALTGERHDLDDEWLTPKQRVRCARLAARLDSGDTASQTVLDNIAKLRKELPETVAEIERAAVETYRRHGRP